MSIEADIRPKIGAPSKARATAVLVAPEGDGWSMRRGDGRAIKTFATQAEAIEAAQNQLRVTGGELRVRSRTGRVRISYTLGRSAMAKINGVEGLKLSKQQSGDFKAFDRQGLSAAERRRKVAARFTKAGA